MSASPKLPNEVTSAEAFSLPGSRDSTRAPLSDAPPPLLPPGTEGSLYWAARGMLRTMRPHQWVKNVFLLAPLVYAKDLFDPQLVIRAGGGFLVFCLLSGCVYTMNDIVDAPSDRVHPVKRRRPIASGQVPMATAKVLAVALFVVAMSGALYGPKSFAATAFLYFILNVAYSFKLKKVAYLDVACLAFFFVLRVVAGGEAISQPDTRVEVSGDMLACTALLALFLGFGKRRHELAGAGMQVAKQQRSALKAYTAKALTVSLALTGVASVGTYVAYTLDPATRAMFRSDWLWLTTFNVIFGVVRFLQLVRGRPKAESPTHEMIRDTPFVVNLIVFVIVVVAIVYRLRPS